MSLKPGIFILHLLVGCSGDPTQSPEPGTEYSFRGILLRPISPPVSEHCCILEGAQWSFEFGFHDREGGGMEAVERKVSVSVASRKWEGLPCALLLPGSSKRPLLSVQSPIAWKEGHRFFSSLSSESHPDTILTPTLDQGQTTV